MFKEFGWGILVSLLSLSSSGYGEATAEQSSRSFEATREFGQEISWQTNFEEAKKQALAENKPLLISFTGSDWCKGCQTLNERIFSDPIFVKEIQNKVVFLNVDFPLHHKLSQEEIKQNQDLKKEYQVDGFPTIVVLLPNGDTITHAGHFPATAKEYASLLRKEIDNAVKLEAVMISFDQEKHSADDLENFYHEARQMGRADYAAKILDAGVAKPANAFFLREKYRLLVEDGRQNTIQAKEIRDELLSQDPDNSQGHHLYVAVSDFQALVKDKSQKKDATAIAAPLENYLNDHGKDDSKNAWRVQLMLSHYLYTMGEKDRAKLYAESAYETAPDKIKPEIQCCIDGIK